MVQAAMEGIQEAVPVTGSWNPCFAFQSQFKNLKSNDLISDSRFAISDLRFAVYCITYYHLLSTLLLPAFYYHKVAQWPSLRGTKVY